MVQFCGVRTAQYFFSKGGIPIELRLICIDITAQAEESCHGCVSRCTHRFTQPIFIYESVEAGNGACKTTQGLSICCPVLTWIVSKWSAHIMGISCWSASLAELKQVYALRIQLHFGETSSRSCSKILKTSPTRSVLPNESSRTDIAIYSIRAEVFTSISIGIALRQTMTKPADFLGCWHVMYRAKSQGSSRYQIFNRNMHAQQCTLYWDWKRSNARSFGQYQPTSRWKLAPLLGSRLRWQHPTTWLQNPAEFILAAEETGLLTRISQWFWCMLPATHMAATNSWTPPWALVWIFLVNSSPS